MFLGLVEKAYFNNIASSLTFFLFLFIFLLITFVLSLFFNKIKEVREALEWDFYIGFIYENYMNFALPAFIQAYYVYHLHKIIKSFSLEFNGFYKIL